MARAYGEWRGNMITVEHTVLCKPELLQDDVISFWPLYIPAALWAGVCAAKREGGGETGHSSRFLTEFKHQYKECNV